MNIELNDNEKALIQKGNKVIAVMSILERYNKNISNITKRLMVADVIPTIERYEKSLEQ